MSDDALMGAVIKPISYADILRAPNAQELIDAYSQECAIPEIGAPCPQSDLYDALESNGSLQSFGVFKDDVLVGFAAVVLPILPHYGQKVATLESIFISPEHRGLGRSLMFAVETFATEQGCASILYSAPAGGQFNRLLESLPQYRHTNEVYCRRLN